MRAQVGPGVKALSEGDVVLPNATFLGTWATSAVWREVRLGARTSVLK